MQCPRCGADNDDARAACWNCFAQIHPPAGSKPRTIQASKPQAVPAAPPQQAPTPTPAPEPVIPPPPQVAEEESEAAAPEPLDLGEPAAESGYVIPGLAEPLPETEQAEQPEPLVAAPAEEETEATTAHVLDLDEFEKGLETPESPAEPKAEEPENEP